MVFVSVGVGGVGEDKVVAVELFKRYGVAVGDDCKADLVVWGDSWIGRDSATFEVVPRPSPLADVLTFGSYAPEVTVDQRWAGDLEDQE